MRENIDLAIHDVVEIRMEGEHDSSSSSYREIKITTQSGQVFTVTVYAHRDSEEDALRIVI
jgi:hypothetical protein